MASSTSRLVLLFVLVGMTGCVVEGISGQRTNVGLNTEMASEEAGGNNLSRVKMPSILIDHVSPLDTKAASSYAAKIEDGSIAEHSKDFCSEAKLLCDANINILDPSFDISLKNLLEGGNLLEKAKALVEASQAMFFGSKDLAVGKEINVPSSLRDQIPTTSFLPEAIAKLLPLSSEKMSELFKTLSIPQNSNLAAMMSRTLAQCQARAQPTATSKATKQSSGMCVTSMEDMTKFVADRFPQDSRIYALERTIPASTDAAPLDSKSGINTFKVLDVKEHEQSVVCHKSMFPFAVYECHNMDSNKNKNVEGSIKMYSVAMESREGGHRMNQIASCRADAVGTTDKTRKALIPGPLASENAACHWISDAFVWASTPSAAEGKH